MIIVRYDKLVWICLVLVFMICYVNAEPAVAKGHGGNVPQRVRNRVKRYSLA